MGRLRLFLATMLLPTLLAFAAAAAPAKPRAAAGGQALGQDLMGEACRLQDAPGAAAEGGARAYEIRCGSWENASGTILVRALAQPVPADSAELRDRHQVLQAEPGATADLDRRAICQPAEPVSAAPDLQLLLRSCRLRSGGWPHVALTTARGARLVQGDGLPAAAEVMVRAFAFLLEGRDATAVPQPELQRRLRDVLGPASLNFGLAEFADFDRLTQLARLSNSVEEYAGAEAAYRAALTIQEKALGESVGVGETLMELALTVSSQGRYEEAGGLFRRADPLVEQSFDKSLRGRLLSYQATDASNAGNYREALILARDSSTLRREVVEELAGPDDGASAATGDLTGARAELIHGLMLEAATALRLGQIVAADAAITEARRLYDRTRGLPGWWQARIRSIQGQVEAAKGNIDRGVILLKQAAQSQLLLFGEGWPLISQLFDLGRVFSDANRHAEAITAFRDALVLLARDGSPPKRLGFERLAPFLKSGIALAEADPAQRDRLTEEMFSAVQLVRDGVVGQTITRAAARLQAGDSATGELVRRQQDAGRQRDRLRLELASEMAKPNRERSQAREAELTRELAAAIQNAQARDQELQSTDPGFTRLSRPVSVPAADLARQLDSDEALSVFAFGEAFSIGFLIRRDGVIAYQLSLDAASLSRQVGDLRRAFVPVSGRLPRFDVRQANALYAALFGPVERQLADAHRLVIVPDGALAALPPALLVTKAPAPTDELRDTAWLSRRLAPSIAPSVSAFVAMRSLASRAPAPKPFIGFANPPFLGAPDAPGGAAEGGLVGLARQCRTGAPLDPALLRALAPLPETVDEVRQVARLSDAGPSSVITGAAVTKAAVRDAGLQQFRVVYFATHGLLPGELHCQAEPGLALAPPSTPPESTADDGLLTASDIAALRLQADLVVLSACNTAGSDGSFGGEALSGLAEAFFFAGARALLVTHWQVPSAPTVGLMTGLFQKLRADGIGAAEALAASQRSLASEPATAHPYFWAAFTLVGDGAPVLRTASAAREIRP